MPGTVLRSRYSVIMKNKIYSFSMNWTVTVPPRSVLQRQGAPDRRLSSMFYEAGYTSSSQRSFEKPPRFLTRHRLLIAVEDVAESRNSSLYLPLPACPLKRMWLCIQAAVGASPGSVRAGDRLPNPRRLSLPVCKMVLMSPGSLACPENQTASCVTCLFTDAH